ncbi:AcrR family transcriptional regulator [Luteibacter sp. HA06]|jgi:AcrR family transcriptional regulator
MSTWRMARESLSRERIIETSIALLDEAGESGLTFRALSLRLATGPGAIYWHIENKSELLTAACDAIVARAMKLPLADASPEASIRAIALGMFDAIDAHPWVGSALTHAPGQQPVIRLLERLGQQLRAIGVPSDQEWSTVSALLNYILGVGGQHAANTQFAHAGNIDRAELLDSVATAWSELDPDEYPFARSISGSLRGHDDRADYLAGIDLILRGIHLPASY